MRGFLYAVWNACKAFYLTHPFSAGLIAGVVLLFIFILFFMIWKRFFAVKKLSGVSYPSSNGMISIRASAISDMVLSLKNDFADLSVHSVAVMRKGKETFLKIQLTFSPLERSFPDACSAFQQKILSAMKETLGVSGISRIDLQLRNNK